MITTMLHALFICVLINIYFHPFLNSPLLFSFVSYFCQGRIIHEVGEAEASGPGPQKGPDRPVQRTFSTTFGPKISREKQLRFSRKF